MKVAKRGTPPWGRWMVLDEGKNYKVKRIENTGMKPLIFIEILQELFRIRV